MDPVVENGIGKLLQYITRVLLLMSKNIINLINKMELSKKAMPFSLRDGRFNQTSTHTHSSAHHFRDIYCHGYYYFYFVSEAPVEVTQQINRVVEKLLKEW